MTLAIITLTTLILAAFTAAIWAVMRRREHVAWFALGFAVGPALVLFILLDIVRSA